MEANESNELQEHAEHGAHEATMRPVAFTMAVLAVLVAITTVLGHRTHTEAVLDQNQATDQWNEYQAHKIRSNDTRGQGGAGRAAREPVRPGRGAAGDWPGDHLSDAADAQPHLLAPGHGVFASGRGISTFSAVAEVA
jgi:hypothetical protein